MLYSMMHYTQVHMHSAIVGGYFAGTCHYMATVRSHESQGRRRLATHQNLSLPTWLRVSCFTVNTSTGMLQIVARQAPRALFLKR